MGSLDLKESINDSLVLGYPLDGIIKLHVLILLISHIILAIWAFSCEVLLLVLANTGTAYGVPALEPQRYMVSIIEVIVANPALHEMLCLF